MFTTASSLIPSRSVRFFSSRVRNLSNKASTATVSSTAASSTAPSTSYSQPLPTCESAYASDEHRQLYRRTRNVDLSPNELHAKIMKFAAAGKIDSAMVVLDALSASSPTWNTQASTGTPKPAQSNMSKMIADPSVDPFALQNNSAFARLQSLNSSAEFESLKRKDDVKSSKTLKLAQAKLRLSVALNQRNIVAVEKAHTELITLKFAPVGIEPIWHFLLESYCDQGDADALCRVLRQLQQCRCALRINVLRDLVSRLTMRGYSATAAKVVDTIGQLKLWQAAVDDAWTNPDPFEL